MQPRVAEFVQFCRVERRLADLTCSAYERDVSACSEYLDRDPAAVLRTPKKREALPDVLSGPELGRLLDVPGRPGVWKREHSGKRERDRLLSLCSPTPACAGRSFSGSTGTTSISTGV